MVNYYSTNSMESIDQTHNRVMDYDEAGMHPRVKQIENSMFVQNVNNRKHLDKSVKRCYLSFMVLFSVQNISSRIKLPSYIQ